MHTRRSDGAGTPDDVADGRGAAGLDFVVLTDHGDATQFIDAPRYIDGVLVLDGVEISTDGRALHRAGHAARAVSPCRRSHATWSRTCTGSAGSVSPRIRIRRKPN